MAHEFTRRDEIAAYKELQQLTKKERKRGIDLRSLGIIQRLMKMYKKKARR
jgi:hypothetical protein